MDSCPAQRTRGGRFTASAVDTRDAASRSSRRPQSATVSGIPSRRQHITRPALYLFSQTMFYFNCPCSTIVRYDDHAWNTSESAVYMLHNSRNVNGIVTEDTAVSVCKRCRNGRAISAGWDLILSRIGALCNRTGIRSSTVLEANRSGNLAESQWSRTHPYLSSIGAEKSLGIGVEVQTRLEWCRIGLQSQRSSPIAVPCRSRCR